MCMWTLARDDDCVHGSLDLHSVSHLGTSSLPLNHPLSFLPTPVTRTLELVWTTGVCIQFRRTLGCKDCLGEDASSAVL